MRKLLILASKSPRRIELLKKYGIPFKIVPAGIREKNSFKKPELVVRDLSYRKALAVAANYPDRPVLGADTIVYCRKKILGKPRNKKDALRLLRTQNGTWQKVFTGITLIWLEKDIFITEHEVSACLARKFSEKELLELAGRHLDKAGAYAVQDKNDYFIKKIEGRFDNVVGFPMNIVRKFLKKIKYIQSRTSKKAIPARQRDKRES